MNTICQKDKSYAIATWDPLTPCFERVSESHNECTTFHENSGLFTSTSIQFCLRSEKLMVMRASNTSRAYHCHKNSSTSIPHFGYYFFSTILLSVEDPYQEYVCQIALKEYNDPKFFHRLLYLNVSVCSSHDLKQPKPSPVKYMHSLTYNERFHRKVGFPVVFNPQPVGSNHPEPFRITSIGLYSDELGRVSLSISTMKPLDSFRCTSNQEAFIKSHRIAYPSFNETVGFDTHFRGFAFEKAFRALD